MNLHIHSLAERPDLLDKFSGIEGDWPDFMQQDPVSQHYDTAVELFPDLHLVALGADDRAVARLHAVPVTADVENLPDRGWDWALESAVQRPIEGRSTVSLIEARVAPAQRGGGLSRTLLSVARERYGALGVRDLIAPVRPNQKHLQPRVSPSDYLAQLREDGLPVDAWLRVHARMGGRMLKVAPLSMVIPGTLQQWRTWTGLPFDTDGLVEVPGGLAPVMVDTATGHAVYVEANIWVHHSL